MKYFVLKWRPEYSPLFEKKKVISGKTCEIKAHYEFHSFGSVLQFILKKNTVVSAWVWSAVRWPPFHWSVFSVPQEKDPPRLGLGARSVPSMEQGPSPGIGDVPTAGLAFSGTPCQGRDPVPVAPQPAKGTRSLPPAVHGTRSRPPTILWPGGTKGRCCAAVSRRFSTQQTTSLGNKEEICLQRTVAHVSPGREAALPRSASPAVTPKASRGGTGGAARRPWGCSIGRGDRPAARASPYACCTPALSEGLVPYKNECGQSSSGWRCGYKNRMAINVAHISIFFSKHPQNNEIPSLKREECNFYFFNVLVSIDAYVKTEMLLQLGVFFL